MAKSIGLIHFQYIIIIVTLSGFLTSTERVHGDSRASSPIKLPPPPIKLTCDRKHENNRTIFVPNFTAVMDNISTQMSSSGYGIAVAGSGGPDTNYGLAQCYGDLSLLDCVLCYGEARSTLPQCYPYTGGRIYLDGCFMRSANYTFFDEYRGEEDTKVCGNTTREDSVFGETVRRAVTTAVVNAIEVKNNGFARVQADFPGKTRESVYVLANCWKSLNTSSCKACLKMASTSLFDCLPFSEGRALHTGCFMRFSDVDFFNKVLRNGGVKGNVVVITVSAASSIVILLVIIVIGFYTMKTRYIQKKRRGSNDAKRMVKTLRDCSLHFECCTLEKATNCFHSSNKIGEGGFGSVYKGVLPDGREIAVKRLFFNNRHRATEFFNEVNIISSVEHKNLVRLLGCSCSGPESLLVYEYLTNKSLDGFIFDSNKGKILDWETRYEIIKGTAEGLVYLHENSKTRIIHRDIKSSNILLDCKLRAKIADFGLARSFQEDKSHISTAIAGTLGYMAPEYLAHGQLTEKADVYSFGVLVLEIVTGKRNNRSAPETLESTDSSLIAMVWNNFQARMVERLYDPNIMLNDHPNCNYLKSEISRVVHIGLLCIQEVPSMRPSMSKALHMMLRTEEQLPAPCKPPFMDETTMELNGTDEDPRHPLNSSHLVSIAKVSYSSFYAR